MKISTVLLAAAMGGALVGAVGCGEATPAAMLPIGTRLRVAPNHTCLTAAAFQRYHVVDGSREVIAVWERINGW